MPFQAMDSLFKMAPTLGKLPEYHAMNKSSLAIGADLRKQIKLGLESISGTFQPHFKWVSKCRVSFVCYLLAVYMSDRWLWQLMADLHGFVSEKELRNCLDVLIFVARRLCSHCVVSMWCSVSFDVECWRLFSTLFFIFQPVGLEVILTAKSE